MLLAPLQHESLRDKFRQFIIYGANGWMGRSTIEVLIDFGVETESILLVGSTQGKLSLAGKEFQVFDSLDAIRQLKPESLFFNYAFLRREKLKELSPAVYTEKNLEIMKFSKEALTTRKVKCLINASSGVAALTESPKTEIDDPYAALKALDEVWLENACNDNSTTFINCRIYSLTGKHINEFDNLAISNFVRDATDKKRIMVKSPDTKRTFVDSMDLSRVLIALALQNENISLDSGGSLVSMEELAQVIAEIFKPTEIKITLDAGSKSEYFGDYKKFNDIAGQLGIQLMGIDEQVALTARAISKAIKSR